ncbi:D-alanyl-D-alanine endopeptidase [Pusillimonas soli]|uniref:D-alanyl-D-alanine endopeptidase n=2 Tax=Allopusillimonas soli TaxID=659016 RepID=A0A853FE87_9BURK|nr:D-alanyl-D-alanine endopeptidase [Allopusillimonas soli]
MTRPLADTSPAPKAQPIALAPSHIVHRQNLKPVGYAPLDGGPASVPGAREDSAESSVEALTGKAVLRSEVAYVQDIGSDAILYDKNGDEVRPIASISKLMTALVVTDARQPMDEIIQVTDADVDRLRYSRSRLRVGTELSRADLLHLALMSSENRAAHALGRNYPGGLPAFVRAMNDKARALGMRNTHFVEPTGLSSENVSSPRDLVKLLQAVSKQPIIHRYTTDDHYEVTIAGGRRIAYNNTNRLVRNDNWNIKISKTGFINEAGECLVMLTRIEGRDLAIVLLNSSGRYSRIGDAVRLRKVVENASSIAML